MIEILKKIKDILTQNDFENIDIEIILNNFSELFDVFSELKNLIEKRKFDLAIQEINRIIYSQFKPKLLYEDDIKGLKTLLKLQEVELSVLAFEKAEIQNYINRFRLKHNEFLSKLIEKILFIRYKIISKKYEENPDYEEDYEDAKKDWENYQKNIELEKSIRKSISKDSKKEIQKMFREASKMCHPDLISDDFKEQASEIFNELNKAYFNNNIMRVREILTLLKSKKIHLIKITEEINEKEKFEFLLQKFKNDAEKLKDEISNLKNSNSYQTIIDIKDWEKYFKELKMRLQNELENLESEYERQK